MTRTMQTLEPNEPDFSTFVFVVIPRSHYLSRLVSELQEEKSSSEAGGRLAVRTEVGLAEVRGRRRARLPRGLAVLIPVRRIREEKRATGIQNFTKIKSSKLDRHFQSKAVVKKCASTAGQPLRESHIFFSFST